MPKLILTKKAKPTMTLTKRTIKAKPRLFVPNLRKTA